uniref:T-box domain-containing protein n=1 Tax=Meloidogyne javanica TaxID=6303 RepID=A0A915MAK2_MELJA
MDNLNNNLSSFGRKRARQTPSPLACPVIKKKARGFWIDQLLEDKQQPLVTVDKNNYLKSPESPVGTSSTLSKRGRKPGKSDNFTEKEPKISTTERESPPLDDHNWLPAKPNNSSLNYLKCELENREIWEQFDQLGTEMVEKEHRFRYAYNKSQWQSAGKAERAQFGRLFPHPDNPIGGDQLAQNGQIISFDKVKLTNNAESTSSDQVGL